VIIVLATKAPNHFACKTFQRTKNKEQ